MKSLFLRQLRVLLEEAEAEAAGTLAPEQGDSFVRTEPAVNKADSKKKRKTYQAAEVTQVRATIRKSDEELQIVWGEVYVPNVPDAHGHYMTPREVEKMAFRTLADAVLNGGKFQGHDTQHDNVRCEDVMIESFVARQGDPDFMPGAWVVGLHIPDPARWDLVKSGKLNGFSMQASVFMSTREIEVEMRESVDGETGPASDGGLHTHRFSVRFSEEGEFLGGETAETDGHTHRIRRGSVTEEADGHSHRFSLLDIMFPEGTLDGGPLAS